MAGMVMSDKRQRQAALLRLARKQPLSTQEEIVEGRYRVADITLLSPASVEICANSG